MIRLRPASVAAFRASAAARPPCLDPLTSAKRLATQATSCSPALLSGCLQLLDLLHHRQFGVLQVALSTRPATRPHAPGGQGLGRGDPAGREQRRSRSARARTVASIRVPRASIPASTSDNSVLMATLLILHLGQQPGGLRRRDRLRADERPDSEPGRGRCRLLEDRAAAVAQRVSLHGPLTKSPRIGAEVGHQEPPR